MIERVSYISMHTSPLEVPGVGDAGGMNVYLDELAATMVGRGVDATVFTRRTDPDAPTEVTTESGYRVVHVDAGPAARLPVGDLPEWVKMFAGGVIAEMRHGSYDLVHSHYWLSGWAGLIVKQALRIPLANSFHTLGRVKDATRRPGQPLEPLLRLAAENELIASSDCVIASTDQEADELLDHYGADPEKLCINPPGIDRHHFLPGDRRGARRRLGLGEEPVVLFVGRIQPLKGVDVAVDAMAEVLDVVPDARLVIVGGPSGAQGSVELDRIRRQIDKLGISGSVSMWEAQPHRNVPIFYHAADVLVVPSRSESFGLVAAEAQATGLPVVAANVGGLRHVVQDGESGRLVDGWDPTDFAKAVLDILQSPTTRATMSVGAIESGRRFSWEATADRLLELYEGITHG